MRHDRWRDQKSAECIRVLLQMKWNIVVSIIYAAIVRSFSDLLRPSDVTKSELRAWKGTFPALMAGKPEFEETAICLR